MENRVYTRIQYPPTAPARLRLEQAVYDLTDISQSGLQIRLPRRQRLPSRMPAILELLCGPHIDVEAICQWQQPGAAGLQLVQPLPAELLEQEKRYVIVHYG